MEPEPWQFGWEALVALGTIGLAGVTAYLAAKTRDLAKESVTDRAAQWRPAIVPASEYLTGPSVDANDERLRIRLRNAGRGPARYLLAGLALGHDPHPEEAIEPAQLWASAVMAPSDEVELEFRVQGRPEVCRVLIDYRDLSDRRYASRLNIDRVARSDAVQQYDLLRISNVIVYEDKRLTPWDEPTFSGSVRSNLARDHRRPPARRGRAALRDTEHSSRREAGCRVPRSESGPQLAGSGRRP